MYLQLCKKDLLETWMVKKQLVIFNIGKHFHFKHQNLTLNEQKADYLHLDTLSKIIVYCYQALVL